MITAVVTVPGKPKKIVKGKSSRAVLRRISKNASSVAMYAAHKGAKRTVKVKKEGAIIAMLGLMPGGDPRTPCFKDEKGKVYCKCAPRHSKSASKAPKARAPRGEAPMAELYGYGQSASDVMRRLEESGGLTLTAPTPKKRGGRKARTNPRRARRHRPMHWGY